MAPGLAECENAVIVPHIASATLWTRAGMVSWMCGGGSCSNGGAQWCWLLSDVGCPRPASRWCFQHCRLAITPTLCLPLCRQATLAAANVAATLQGYPVWNKPDVLPFVVCGGWELS